MCRNCLSGSTQGRLVYVKVTKYWLFRLKIFIQNTWIVGKTRRVLLLDLFHQFVKGISVMRVTTMGQLVTHLSWQKIAVRQCVVLIEAKWKPFTDQSRDQLILAGVKI